MFYDFGYGNGSGYYDVVANATTDLPQKQAETGKRRRLNDQQTRLDVGMVDDHSMLAVGDEASSNYDQVYSEDVFLGRALRVSVFFFSSFFLLFFSFSLFFSLVIFSLFLDSFFFSGG